MMNESGVQRMLPDQSSGSGHTLGTLRHPSIVDPIPSKRVCFYKSGDPQFNGLRMVINNRTFKTFDALLDSLSKKVPLPFGVRNITTPRGVHAINTLDELEDGKSYICSDSRKVKPINLALARKKLPPWYHARPEGSRRRTVQKARLFPGRNIHMPEPVAIRTPKKLLVFRNGDPTVRHTVVLQKKSTPSYESILEYISGLMQFHVVKLHTPDGKRVDGLPGLILCSGIVVAVGREPFRPAIYSAQKSSSPAWLHNRRQKALNRKKKSLSHSSKLRNFSPSSERYIVSQIHNTIAESIPSNHTNSIELESSQILESVAKTEEDTSLGDGAEGQDCSLPNEDDIEKSFRVNQDGSMTVEMRVRLTIKEEETIHWTTTLTRSSVANQLNAACLPEPEPEQEICFSKSTSLDLQSPAESSVNSINKDKTKDSNDEDPPSPNNRAFSESINEEDDFKNHTDMALPRRVPTPGHKQIRKKQASMESIKSLTADGIQEEMVGSYSYREQTENGTMTEQYCMVKQSSSRPVPKPRKLGSVDGNSRFKSTGTSEMLQIESSEEEITETVLHIYEQQTCQDNYLANICAQGMPTPPSFAFGRPATSETAHLSGNNECEPELWRPSTASESISIWRTESMSVTSDLNSASLKITNGRQKSQKLTKAQVKPQRREVTKDKKESLKPKETNKHVRHLMSPGKRQKENSAEPHKKAKTFSSAGFIKRIYGNKSKSAKSTKKLKKRPLQKGDGSATPNSLSDDTIKSMVEHSKIPSVSKDNTNERVSFETSKMSLSSAEVSQPRGILTRQTSMHREKKSDNKSHDISESISLPAFNSSSSITNEYVENWLEKAHINPQTENDMCGESENNLGLIIVAEEVKYLEETSKIETRQTSEPPTENVLGTSVKLRVQSFENKGSSASVGKTTVSQQIVHNHTTTTNTDNCKSVSEKNTSNKTSTEMPLRSEKENRSSLVKISFQKATPSHTLSMELPPPPSPTEITELSNTEYYMKDVSSVASSPLYCLSSSHSPRTDNHPVLASPTTDISPNNNTIESASPVQTDMTSSQSEAQLSRVPSVKRAPLVSNLSLERKMSLRKASLDKHTLTTDATSKTTTLSTPTNTAQHGALPTGICSTGTQRPVKAPVQETQQPVSDLMSSHSCCTSVSPASFTSEERASSASIPSSEASLPSSLPLEETKINKTQFFTQKEASSPKTTVKKAKLISNPSPERKFLNRKSSLEHPSNSPKLSSVNNHPQKTRSPNMKLQRQPTPNASPSTDRKQIYTPKMQKRPSPYSQSLDVASPPVKHKSSRKMLSRNVSSDNPSEAQRKSSLHRKTPQSVQSDAELKETLTCGTVMPQEANRSDENKADLVITDQDKSMTDMQIIPQALTTANQPNMKPVLDQICYSIKSIRQITQNKRPSCLEKSNSLPDFSSHVASTFGSSSKALLAFLSVMTLKDGITSLNMDGLNANNVSCAEALKMIDCLREIASIEDSHKLKTSLSNLQQSASKQLLQSWKGFQELSDRCKSRSSTSSSSEQKLTTAAIPEQEYSIEENVIDELMDSLDIPEEVKEELASLSVGAKTDNEENMSERVIERVEPSPKENSVEKTSHLSIEDDAKVPQDDDANVDVRSVIKKCTYINQPKQSGMDSIHLTAKHKAAGQALKDNDDQYGQNDGTMISEERQLYSTSFVQENKEDLQSCGDAIHQGNQEEQTQHNEEKSSSERTNTNGVVSSRSTFEKEYCDFETEGQDMDCRQLQMQIEENTHIPTNQFTHEKSFSDKDGQKASSANEDLAEKDSCEQSVSSSPAGEQHEEPEVETKQENSEGEDLSNPERHSEEEEIKQPSLNCYVALNVKGKKSMSSLESENPCLSEEEQPEVECKKLSNNLEREQPTCRMRLNVSDDESTGNSDVDEPSSEEEQQEVDIKHLQVIVEETSSGIEEEEEEDMKQARLYVPPHDGEQTKKHKGLEALIEETEDDNVSSEDADKTQLSSTVERDRSNLIENQDSYTKNDNSGLAKGYRFNADDDSGNDHSSCEEHVAKDQPKVKNEQISSSMEEELSYYDKASSSEEEHGNMDRYTKESHTQYNEGPIFETQSDVKKCETAVEKEIISQSVAERVTLLEQQVAESQKRKNSTRSSTTRCFSQRKVPLDSDGKDSSTESPTSQVALHTRSAPQSSLSFSYDSSGIITTEPEGSRVKSIREMFLAKSATDIQQRHFPSPNASEVPELRAETSASGGYQSQTLTDPSSDEDDSARKSISKGFVRRTIERLYGKKDVDLDEGADERLPSEPKQKNKEHSSIFSSLQTVKSKAASELSYFNSTNVLDTFTEATRCIAFNAQVAPGDSVPIDDGRWLLRQDMPIRKSISDPVGINKTFTNTPECEETCKDTEENNPYSLFSTKSELEDKAKSFSGKCTYFSLPHGSDSEACQDEVCKGSGNGDMTAESKDNSDTKTQAENGMLPSIGVTDFKKMDNKVHPLTEPPSDGEVVVLQPGKGQGVINRFQEPDMLDLLYNFCGQNCPIL